MRHRVLSVAFFLGAAACLASVLTAPLAPPAAAQSTDAKPTEQAPANGQDAAKETQKIDEFAEAQKALGGPAGNPECVWLGRRVLSLLWNDDLDTAFRHLDLYDRFGCPSGHVQASFRCLLLHSAGINPKTADPKAGDSLSGRVQACWLNPNQQLAPAPAAAVPSPTTNR
jgi:hypothetical protein